MIQRTDHVSLKVGRVSIVQKLFYGVRNEPWGGGGEGWRQTIQWSEHPSFQTDLCVLLKPGRAL